VGTDALKLVAQKKKKWSFTNPKLAWPFFEEEATARPKLALHQQ
jgi:hypothetical protein